MKIRKKYVVILYHYRQVVELTKPTIRVDGIQNSSSYYGGVSIYDCNFKEAKHNIKLAIKRGYYLIKK